MRVGEEGWGTLALQTLSKLSPHRAQAYHRDVLKAVVAAPVCGGAVAQVQRIWVVRHGAGAAFRALRHFLRERGTGADVDLFIDVGPVLRHLVLQGGDTLNFHILFGEQF